MPDLIRHPVSIHIRIAGFRLRGRNDKSQSDNTKFASPEGEGFQSSPKDTLIHGEVVQFTLCGMSYDKGWISQQYLSFGFEVIYGWRWFYGV